MWVWTHDSVGLGEDGPTHQPVEHYAALRAIPNLWVIRPGDANETARRLAGGARARGRPGRAAALAPEHPGARPRRGRGAPRACERGGYVLWDCRRRAATPRADPDRHRRRGAADARRPAQTLAAEGTACASSRCPAWSCSKPRTQEYREQVLPRGGDGAPGGRAGRDDELVEVGRQPTATCSASTASAPRRRARRCSRSSASPPRTSPRARGRCSSVSRYELRRRSPCPPRHLTPAAAPLRARPERVDRLPLARLDPRRAPAGADRRRLGRRRDVEPDDLPEGDGRRATPTTSSCASSPRGRRASRTSSGRWPSRTSTRPATCSARSGTAAAAATATSRSRSTRGLAYDTLATFREAMRLHEAVDRPNLMVKIPATKPGLAAIEDVIAKGRSINVTLIFSLRRYAEVAESYLRGLERLVAEGGDPREVASVASFFVSRIDTEADRRLRRGRRPRRAQGQARDRQREARLRALPGGLRRAALGVPRRQGRHAAARAVGLDVDEEPGLPGHDVRRGADRAGHRQHDARGDDQGLPGPRRAAGAAGAAASRRRTQRVRASSPQAGVDYDDVTDTLEREGVEKFSAVLRRADRGAGTSKRTSLARRLRRAAARRCAALSCRGSGSARGSSAAREGNAFGVDGEHAEAAPAVGVGAARGHRARARAPRLFLTSRGCRPAAHVHQHVEPGEAPGEAQVALVVLDREHEAADRARRAGAARRCTGRARTARRRRRAAARPPAR